MKIIYTSIQYFSDYILNEERGFRPSKKRIEIMVKRCMDKIAVYDVNVGPRVAEEFSNKRQKVLKV